MRASCEDDERRVELSLRLFGWGVLLLVLSDLNRGGTAGRRIKERQRSARRIDSRVHVWSTSIHGKLQRPEVAFLHPRSKKIMVSEEQGPRRPKRFRRVIQHRPWFNRWRAAGGSALLLVLRIVVEVPQPFVCYGVVHPDLVERLLNQLQCLVRADVHIPVLVALQPVMLDLLT